MKVISLFLALLAGAALSLHAQSADTVQTEIKNRTGADVFWEKEMTARTDTTALVKKMLRKPLTVASAVQIALLSNRGLQATFGDIGIAQADVMEAVTIPNPTVDFDVQYPVAASAMNRYGWLVAQDFVQLLMIPLKKKMAEQQLESSQLRVASEVLDLVAEVKVAYFTYQGSQQLLGRLKLIQETNAAALDLAQKQFAVGNITEFALLQSQSTYSQGRLDLARAETDLRGEREKLNRLMGLWGSDISWEIKGDIMPIPASDFSVKNLESLAVAQRLDLRAAQRDLARLLEALGLTKTYRWVPVMDFGFTGERDIDGALNMGPSFRFELPIFNQGQARIAQGQAQLRITENKFESLAVEIRSEVREYRDRLLSLADSARFYHDELLPTRIRMVNQATLQYNAMQLSSYELFSVKAQELEAERGYIDVLRDYWITRAELEKSVGGTLTPRPRKEVSPPPSMAAKKEKKK